MNTNLKENISGNSTFQYFRGTDLWYKTETGLVFPVPISDIGDATFNATEKSMIMMRYIRKHIASLLADQPT